MLVGLVGVDPQSKQQIVKELTRITDLVSVRSPATAHDLGIFVTDTTLLDACALLDAARVIYVEDGKQREYNWWKQFNIDRMNKDFHALFYLPWDGTDIEYYTPGWTTEVCAHADKKIQEWLPTLDLDCTTLTEADPQSNAWFIATALGLEINAHML